MSLEEMTELFSMDGLQKKAAVFDPKKLEWMNGQHLSRLPAAAIEPQVTRELVRAHLTDAKALAANRAWYLELLDLLKVSPSVHGVSARRCRAPRRTSTTSQRRSPSTGRTARQRRAAGSNPQATRNGPTLVGQRLGEALRARRGESERRKLFRRSAGETGMAVSPGIFEVLVAMGRERSLQRLDTAVRL
jgi:glutamyl-tRNA synthetase